MYQIDFNKPINIHFIGIGGISMSGLAEILLDRGFGISGSDAKESDLTKHLIQKGAMGSAPPISRMISSSLSIRRRSIRIILSLWKRRKKIFPV